MAGLHSGVTVDQVVAAARILGIEYDRRTIQSNLSDAKRHPLTADGYSDNGLQAINVTEQVLQAIDVAMRGDTPEEHPVKVATVSPRPAVDPVEAHVKSKLRRNHSTGNQMLLISLKTARLKTDDTAELLAKISRWRDEVRAEH